MIPLLSKRLHELVLEVQQHQQHTWQQAVQRYMDANQVVRSEANWFDTVSNALPMQLLQGDGWLVGDLACLIGFDGEQAVLNGHRVQLLMSVKSPPRWDVELVDIDHKLRVPESCLQAADVARPLMGGGSDRPARTTAGRHPAREQAR